MLFIIRAVIHQSSYTSTISFKKIMSIKYKFTQKVICDKLQKYLVISIFNGMYMGMFRELQTSRWQKKNISLIILT